MYKYCTYINQQQIQAYIPCKFDIGLCTNQTTHSKINHTSLVFFQKLSAVFNKYTFNILLC